MDRFKIATVKPHGPRATYLSFHLRKAEPTVYHRLLGELFGDGVADLAEPDPTGLAVVAIPNGDCQSVLKALEDSGHFERTAASKLCEPPPAS